MRTSVRTPLLAIVVAIACVSAGLGAHEQPTHIAITQEALNYLLETDPVRYKLLVMQFGIVPLVSTLSDGSWNEDADFFDPCTLNSAACFIGRFFFHFLPKVEETVSVSPITVKIGATCTSIGWATGGPCDAFIVPLSPPVGIPKIDVGANVNATNDHTWAAAISETNPLTGAPTLAGWRHLSFMLHLVEDLTSPPHARGSPHPCWHGLGLCDAVDSLGLIAINRPKSDYVGLANLNSFSDVFTRVRNYTHANYFSTRTLFNGDGGPALTLPFDDPDYAFGACLPVSHDVGTCRTVGGFAVRRIAHKGADYKASAQFGAPDLKRTQIDSVVAHEQFVEIGPVGVLAAATLIQYYAPLLTVEVTSQSQAAGSVVSTPNQINCNHQQLPACSGLFGRTSAGEATVTLTATEGPGSIFIGWGGHCSGTAKTATVVMSSDRHCTAQFELLCHTYLPSGAGFPRTVVASGKATITNTKPNGSFEVFFNQQTQFVSPQEAAAAVLGNVNGLLQECGGVFPSASASRVDQAGIFRLTTTVTAVGGVLTVEEVGHNTAPANDGNCPANCLQDIIDYTKTWVYDIKSGAYTLSIVSDRNLISFNPSTGNTLTSISHSSGTVSGQQ